MGSGKHISRGGWGGGSIRCAEAQRAARYFIIPPNGSTTGKCHSQTFWGVWNVRGGSTLSFCFSTQPDAAHCQGTCPKNRTPNRTQWMQHEGESDKNQFENLAQLKKLLHVASHLKFHRSVASLGSCRDAPSAIDPPLKMPHHGQLRYLPDPRSAWFCMSRTDPGAAQRKSFRDSNVKSKLNFES